MFIPPMLLHRLDEPPIDDSEYITELKLDGIRLILSTFDNETKLYTRHNNDVTALFPEITSIPIPDGIVLDGELIALGDDGKPDFELMMSRFKSKKLINQVNVQFVVFDIIYSKNDKVTSMPLISRKRLLSKSIPTNQQRIVETQFIEGRSSAYFDVVKEQGLEGIVIKKSDSTYGIGKRSPSWLKLINYQYRDVYISGLRKNEFGVIMQDENGRYLGIMEFVPSAERKEIYKRHKSLIIGETKDYIKLEPQMKCKVKFRNWTKNNLMRIPSFVKWID